MSRVLMTLAISEQHEQALIDFLLDLPQPPAEVTVLKGHAIGPQIPLLSAHEQVKGRARRTLLQLAIEPQDSAVLLAALAPSFAGKRLTWWLTPILEQGELP